eukprot:scaffold3375_cov101-Isochrysis_galbana.AAC.3
MEAMAGVDGASRPVLLLSGSSRRRIRARTAAPTAKARMRAMKTITTGSFRTAATPSGDKLANR